MSSIIVTVALYIGGAILAIWFGLNSAKDAITINSSNSTKMIGIGQEEDKEKAKILEKEKPKDPAAPSNVNNNYIQTVEMPYNPQQLPNMRGVDYGYYGNEVSQIGMDPRFYDPSMLDLEEGKISVVQDGEVSNAFEKEQKITGPVTQTGTIYNINTQGIEKIGDDGNQNSSEILNNEMQTALSEGRIDVEPLGNSNKYIENEEVLTIIESQKDYIPRLKINGVSAGSLYAQKYTAPKAIRANAQSLIEANVNQGIEESGERIRLNDKLPAEQNVIEIDEGISDALEEKSKVVINFNMINLLNDGNRRFVSSVENLPKMLSLEQAFSNPQAQSFTKAQMVTLAGVYQQTDMMALAGNSSYQNVITQVIQERPDIKNPKVVEFVANSAIPIKEEMNRNRQSIAAFKMNSKKSQKELQASNMDYLNNIIKSNTSITNQFNNLVNESYRKEMEQKAKENIERRADMSLEEKEKELKQLLESGDEEGKKIVEERIKEQILANPDGANNIIGEEGVKNLKEHIKQEKERMYQQHLVRQEKIADNEFRKTNDKYKNSTDDKVREERMKSEMSEAINKAVEEIYSRIQKEKDKKSKRGAFEEYRKRRELSEEQNLTNMEGNTPQPTGSSSIYIPRSVQEQMAQKDIS